jgi:methylthioribose-1-phosphate isomerase
MSDECALGKCANCVQQANATHAVQLPRALTNQKGYMQHVSPFAPVATIAPPASSAVNSRELENARLRIQSLAKERSFYQRNLRKATAIDPKTGKTNLQKLQAENASLRRVNANQAQKLEDIKKEVIQQNSKFGALGEQYNEVAKRLHKAMVEIRELKGQ